MKKSKNHEAKLAVAQVYWTADYEYKAAEARRGRCRDLALTAISTGETVGPVHGEDDDAHWLTHGQKERVEMDAGILWAMDQLTTTSFMALMTVNTAALKHAYPTLYVKMLRHQSTKRTAYDCLTWADKEPAARPKRKAKR